MLVTTKEEISEVLPTSRWKYPELLIGMITEEQDGVLEPILGTTLLCHLETKNEELNEKYGGVNLEIFTRNKAEDADKPYITLLASCRRAVITRMMANKVMGLSTSFNEGGGFNRMEGENYTAVTLEEMREIKNEYWHRSLRAIEDILVFLERDARSNNPVFSEMWRESDYFWNHAELLLNNMRNMWMYVPSRNSNMRMEYVELLPEIRYCQNSYILQSLGQSLIDLLLRVENPLANKQYEDDNDKDGDGSENKYSPTPSHKKALNLVRTALGMFVTWKITKNAQREMMTSAEQALKTAEAYIIENEKEFENELKQAPCFQKILRERERQEKEEEKHKRMKQKWDDHYEHFTKLF